MEALESAEDSEVRDGFNASFQSTESPPPSSGSESDDIGHSIDGSTAASYSSNISPPHVSTAAASQNVHVPAPAQGMPPVAPIPQPAAPAVAAAVLNVAQQQMAQPAPPRMGSLNQPPPPLGTAANVAVLTENLEAAPLVAALVERGLLKTEDVLSKPYVEAMERQLRDREITKSAQGRDVRYRSTRAAYRAPVNVTTTGIAGVYRYQRPRFARPSQAYSK